MHRLLDGFDLRAAQAVHRLDSPAADAIMRAASRLGSWPLLLGLALGCVVWMAWRGHRRSARVVGAVALAAGVATWLLKELFHRARPALFYEVPRPSSFSLPSGHALMSTAVYGIVALVLARSRPEWRMPLAAVTTLLVLVIGSSRVYLGVHWPTDVLAAFAAGVILLVAGSATLGHR